MELEQGWFRDCGCPLRKDFEDMIGSIGGPSVVGTGVLT